MIETLAHRYSSESTKQELSNEYQHDRDWLVFKKICALVLKMKVASALERVNNTILFLFIPGTWVLIYEYSVRAIQRIPT